MSEDLRKPAEKHHGLEKMGEALPDGKGYSGRLLDVQQENTAAAPDTSKVESGLPAHDVKSRWPALMDKLVKNTNEPLCTTMQL